jgi:hypothetical protein
MAHCKQQWNPRRLGSVRQASDQAPRMTASIIERNICWTVGILGRRRAYGARLTNRAGFIKQKLETKNPAWLPTRVNWRNSRVSISRIS